MFIIFSCLGFLALSRISSHLQENYGGEVSANFNAQLVLWSLPFYAGAATLFLGGTIDHKTAIISALGIISLGMVGFYKRKFSHQSDPNFWSTTLLVALLISLIPVELAVLLSRMPMGLIGDIKVKSFVVTSNVLIVLGFIFAIFVLTKDPGTHSPRHSDSRLLATPSSCRRVAACNPNWDLFYEIRSGSLLRFPLFRPL